MRGLLLIYIVSYAVVYLAVYIADALLSNPDDAPLWEQVADVTLLSVGFAGMVFYYLDVDRSGLLAGWKIVAPALLLGQLGMFIRFQLQRPQLVAGAEKDDISEREVTAIEVGTTVFLIPSLILNLAYAYL